MPRLESPADLDSHRSRLLAQVDADKERLTVCSGTGCHAARSDAVHAALVDEISKAGLSDRVDVVRTGCQGFCEQGAIVGLERQKLTYLRVKPDDAADIVNKTLAESEPVERLLYTTHDGKKLAHKDDMPFYINQNPVVFGLNHLISPLDIDSYIEQGGYSALVKALFEMSPEQIVDEIKASDLRGRGGGGFRTGLKWQTTKDAPDPVKYVAVNADEGDPGAYMDRSLLEGNPHRVLEGLLIGARAIGAHEGFVYVRQEYPLAVANLSVALEQAREYGLLGENILGSGFAFDVKVHRGAGAFVSGESSALMAAIEGQVGEPRPKYVRTAVSGIWGHPTNLNNVETWATVPLIISNGAEWFRGLGSETSKGTKIFSLVGKVVNTGLVEVPMGTTLRTLVFDVGGGIPDGRKFKAVQTGGPSGGVIPESLLDVPVGFDELDAAGSMMGSGGMIVMDEDTCMVDTARYYMNFLAEESCGKCVPCREGIHQMLTVLNRICAGDGREGDVELLEEIAEVLSDFSLCALGATAANPVLSTIKHFLSEYQAHIYDKVCPSRVCKALISYEIKPGRCRGCMICLKSCPAGAIVGTRNEPHVIDPDLCTRCGVCLEVCPTRYQAVEKVSGEYRPEPAGVGAADAKGASGDA